MNMKRRLFYTLALLFATLQTFAQTYTYDSNYRLVKVLYENGVTVNYTYDALGNRLKKTVTGATSETYTITTAVTPSGSGTVTGGGTYAKGATVELNAIANAGYEFSKWSDGDIDNPRTITVDGNKSFTAQFVAVTDIVGDVNSDGVVGIGDIVAVTNVMAGIANDAALQRRADVNDDGMVGIGDIVAITNIMAGIGGSGGIEFTDQVNLDASSWGGNGMVDWAAPEVTTSDGRTTPLAEYYIHAVYMTGTVLEQTLTGLPNGTYKVELYANAYYTDGRGFSSDATEGQMDMVYLFANDTMLYIPVHIGTEFTVSDEYTLTAKVTDGTLRMGMYSEKAGTNWWTIQVKSLSRTGN